MNFFRISGIGPEKHFIAIYLTKILDIDIREPGFLRRLPDISQSHVLFEFNLLEDSSGKINAVIVCAAHEKHSKPGPYDHNGKRISERPQFDVIKFGDFFQNIEHPDADGPVIAGQGVKNKPRHDN